MTTSPTPRLVPDRPSDAAIAQAFREFGGKSSQDSPTSSLGAYGWMFRRASEIDTATTVAVDHGMTCSDMEVAYDCAQQVIADQKARIERLESLLFAEQTKLAPGYPTPEMLRAAVECRYGPATYKCVSAAGTSAYEQEAADDYAAMLAAAPPAEAPCTCPSGDGSLRHPCPVHPAEAPGGLPGVPWRREWQGSGDQRGFHIVEAVRLCNNKRVAYLGDVPGEQVDRIIEAHNAQLAAAPAAPAEGDVLIELNSLEMAISHLLTTQQWIENAIPSRLNSIRALITPRVTGGRADSARLDWLEKNGCGQFQGPHTHAPADRYWFDSETTGSDYGPTLRAMIDAAMTLQAATGGAVGDA